ncbi:Ig-like domain-containing protein [Arthrobacter sp. FW305-123]|nr:Ig-like domain-containing protein [Arthrobacter sp. FW305-123]
MGRWNRFMVVVLGILLVSWGGPAASAFWGSLTSGPASAKADALTQGAKPATAVNGTTVTLTWAASTTTAGRPVTGYSIARYDSATGGSRVPATGGCAGTVTGPGCVESNVPAGTWYYSVTPLLSAWQGPESIRSDVTAPVTDTTAPLAPAVTAPSYVHQGNVAGVPVSGTAEAGSTVVLTVTGAGAQPLTQTMTANGSGNWTAAPLNLSAFSEGAISYSARATDAAGNTGPAGTAASTKDVTTPTVTNVQLNNFSLGVLGRIDKGDSLTITFSEDIRGTSICSTWPATGTQTLGNGGQVAVHIDQNDLLTVTAGGCALNLGTVFLGADYTSTALSFSGNGMGNGTTPNYSSLAWSGNRITITLGAGPSSAGTVASTSVFPTYTPASGLTDTASNPLVPGSVSGTPSRF